MTAARKDSLNEEQRAVFDFVVNGFPGAKEKLLYIDGPAGTGKTFLINCLYQHITETLKDHVLCCAYTGIASTLLPDGITIHSAFRIPVSDNLEFVGRGMRQRWNKDSKWLENMRVLQWIIIDECSMVPRFLIDLIDQELRRVFYSHKPFGGKTVIFSGDFRQLLPVVSSGASKEKKEANTLKHSTLWELTTQMQLTRNVRAKEDAEYADFLLTVGNGDMTTFDVPDDMRHSDLVSYVYGPHLDGQQTTRLLGNDVILTTTNAEADKLNQLVLSMLKPDVATTYKAADMVYELDVSEYDKLLYSVNPVAGLKMCKTVKKIENGGIAQFVKSFDHPDLQPLTFEVKPCSLVVMTKNIDQKRRLCNGTRLCVDNTLPNELKCVLLVCNATDTDTKEPETITVTRVDSMYRMSAVNLDAAKFAPRHHRAYVVVRNQLPLKLAFAMTTHHSQGQTFNKVGLYLMNYGSIFTDGQLYAALSRSNKRENVKICSISNKVRNVVNKKLLCK